MSDDSYRVRPLLETDLAFVRDVRNDDDTRVWLTHVRHVGDQRDWYDSLRTSTTSRRYVVEYHGVRVAVIRVDAIDHVNGSAMVGVDVAPEFRGQGHGRFAMRWIVDELFSNERMHRLHLKVAATNERARNLYESLGFRVEGVERDALYRGGRYVDYVVMSLLEDEWRAG